jgi:hypothetical protein
LISYTAGPIPLRVREADVPIVSEGECVRQINAVTEKIFIMPASSFCAGGEAGNDACQVNTHKIMKLKNEFLDYYFSQNVPIYRVTAEVLWSAKMKAIMN